MPAVTGIQDLGPCRDSLSGTERGNQSPLSGAGPEEVSSALRLRRWPRS